MAGWRHLAFASLLAILPAGCGTGQTDAANDAQPSTDTLALTGTAARLSSVCSGCHAVGGSALVSLEGRSAADLEARLNVYKSDPSGTTVMHRLARGYTDAELAEIAAYLGTMGANQ